MCDALCHIYKATLAQWMYTKAGQLTCDKKAKPSLKLMDWGLEDNCFINWNTEIG